MIKMKGIGASNGIAIAKVLVLKHEAIQTNAKKIELTEIKAELEHFHNALTAVAADIQILITTAIKNLGQDKANIFEAHLLITNDPDLIAGVETLIKDQQYNAAKALETVANQIIATWDDDPYFRERIADIIDVRDQILRKILNINNTNLTNINEATIIVAHDLTPSVTSQLNPQFIKGFLCDIGGKTSHASIMARSIGIPAVLGLKNITEKIKDQQICALDGNSGIIEINLSVAEKQKWEVQLIAWNKFQKELLIFKGKLTKTNDQYEVKLEANIGSPKDIPNVLDNDAQGIGLFRSEFLYMENNDFPTEEQQFNEYKAVLEQIKHKVVIRTLDIGGDKELSYLKLGHETNPFLGYRAIRLCLDRTDIFKTQLRALLRASVYGELAIMFPMIATVEEFKSAKALTLQCKAELEKAGIKVNDNIKIGMMIEIPAAAINAHVFAKYADFFSIGTNDLIQYSIAVDRMSEKVSYLYQPYHPAILKLIQMTIAGAHQNNIPVAMCGEMAADKIAVPLLIGMGLDEFSMSASSILATRKLISTLNKKEMEKLVALALSCETNAEVKMLVEQKINQN